MSPIDFVLNFGSGVKKETFDIEQSFTNVFVESLDLLSGAQSARNTTAMIKHYFNTKTKTKECTVDLF